MTKEEIQKISERIHTSAEYIEGKIKGKPTLGIVLGSGLGDFCEDFSDAVNIPFSEIPGFPVPTVEGHSGMVTIGSYHGKSVMALHGRVHYYEGGTQAEITIPIRVMKLLGVKTVLLTNACGGINLSYHPGDLMLINDHINFSGQNPLIGLNLDEFGTRFPEMAALYTSSLRDKVKVLAAKLDIPLKEGVYIFYSGPSFETPAEIRAFRILGADACGMSTVPEAIVAHHAGMNVIGISCITNMAAGINDVPLKHEEVLENAEKAKDKFTKLVDAIIREI